MYTISVWIHSSSLWVSKVSSSRMQSGHFTAGGQEGRGPYSSSKMHYSASLYQAQGQVPRQGPCREELTHESSLSLLKRATRLRSPVIRVLGKSSPTLTTPAG
ncbi:RIKEN cDNA D630004N19 [Mus musculus]|uniref:Mitochondrial ribosomal protein L48 n=1 Tax=Mus musculus TaxID=10090 RepID=Q8C3P2_MOUSE|nr:RIKEN cDNA D630004N19 [Mus musculus]BAC39411.1 unnamed protein product [Mus musculus]